MADGTTSQALRRLPTPTPNPKLGRVYWQLGVLAWSWPDCVPSRRSTGRARRNDAVRREAILEARERHVLPGVERVEERLELGLVRMIGDVAAVEHLHRQLAPGVAVEAVELLRVEAVVEQAAFAADQVGVEVVGLQAIHDGGALPHGP